MTGLPWGTANLTQSGEGHRCGDLVTLLLWSICIWWLDPTEGTRLTEERRTCVSRFFRLTEGCPQTQPWAGT